MDNELLASTPYTPSILAKSLQYGGDSVAIEFGERWISRSELRDQISRYAKALLAQGIRRGDRVAFLSRNRPELLYFTCAALMDDICVVPLQGLGSVQDNSFICSDAEVKAVVFDSHFESVANRLADLQPDLTFFSLGPCVAAASADLNALAAAETPGPLEPPSVQGHDVCRLSYTGGTTGRPKAAMITYRIFLHMLMVQLIEWEWPSQIRHLICAPISHAGASAVLPTLIRGGTLVLLPGFEATEVLEAIQRRRITSTLMVPSMIYKILDHPNFSEYDLSSLQTIFYGASSISPDRLKEALVRIGPVFYQFYAQAEAPMVITGLRKRDHDPSVLGRLSSCGRPMPWINVSVLDIHGWPVQIGQPGELCIRGPIVMSGYLGRPEETSAALEGSWLHTGDIAMQDDAGFLFIVDRKKDMIVTGGINVFSREVEDALCGHPAVAQAVVFGVPHALWGEAVHAGVVLRTGMRAELKELMACVREKKGKANVPKDIQYLSSIPLTSIGKPDKVKLRNEAVSRQTAATAESRGGRK